MLQSKRYEMLGSQAIVLEGGPIVPGSGVFSASIPPALEAFLVATGAIRAVPDPPAEEIITTPPTPFIRRQKKEGGTNGDSN
jgi:hypothetical protein